MIRLKLKLKSLSLNEYVSVQRTPHEPETKIKGRSLVSAAARPSSGSQWRRPPCSLAKSPTITRLSLPAPQRQPVHVLFSSSGRISLRATTASWCNCCQMTTCNGDAQTFSKSHCSSLMPLFIFVHKPLPIHPSPTMPPLQKRFDNQYVGSAPLSALHPFPFPANHWPPAPQS